VNVWPATVSVALRAAPVFGVTRKVTEPDPVPVAPVVIVTHSTGLDAVHAHPSPVVTAIVPDPPTTSNDCAVGAIVNAQPDACSTVNVWPATESVPVLAGPAFAATLKRTLPDPVPLAPAVIEIHWSALVALHVQLPDVVTATLPVPPALPIAWLAGLMV
jgi:hypothetical protein